MDRLKFWLGQTLVDDAAEVPPETGLTQAVAGVMLNCMFGRVEYPREPPRTQPAARSAKWFVVLAKEVVDDITLPLGESQAVLSKHTSINTLSLPFQIKGVAKVWVYQPVVEIVTVVGPITVVGFVGLKKEEPSAVAEVAAILMVKLLMARLGRPTTLKPNAVMVPGPVPVASSSEASTKYWLRPSSYNVPNGVIAVDVVGVVPVPMVYTWAESCRAKAKNEEVISSFRSMVFTLR